MERRAVQGYPRCRKDGVERGEKRLRGLVCALVSEGVVRTGCSLTQREPNWYFSGNQHGLIRLESIEVSLHIITVHDHDHRRLAGGM